MKFFQTSNAPDLRIDQLALWVHGREFENAEDYWDGNWLRATVHCGAAGAEVTVSGAFVRVPELMQWALECQALHAGMATKAELPALEPNLTVDMEMNALRHIAVTVRITPDSLNQEHVFRMQIDQSYLPEIIRALHAITAKYPPRGSPAE